MVKVKHVRTADCAVAGFRWHKQGKGELIGSLLLGLYDAHGMLQHVGVTSASDSIHAARRLQGRVGPQSTLARIRCVTTWVICGSAAEYQCCRTRQAARLRASGPAGETTFIVRTMLIKSVRVGAALAAATLFLQSCASSPSPAEVQRREHDRTVLTLVRLRQAVEKEMGAYEPTTPRDVIPPGVPVMTATTTIKLDGFGTPIGVEELRRNCRNALPELQGIEGEARQDLYLSPLGCRILVKRAEAAVLRTLTGVAYAKWQMTGALCPPDVADLDLLSNQDRSARGL